MNRQDHQLRDITRRHFFNRCSLGVGSLALQQILAGDCQASVKIDPANPMASRRPHHTAKAKRVIYLFMAGGPSQLDLFDHKPLLEKYSGQKPPESLMSGKRFAFLKGNETLLASPRKFGTYGQSGMTLSDLFPHHRKIVDDVCWMKGVTTDVFNHGPAKLFMNTGFQAPGRASMGSWVTYGLGSEAQDLPGFVVLQSGPRGPRAGAQLWSSGFLPTSFQGVPLRGSGDPILNLNSPAGMTRERERRFYDVVGALNRARLDVTGDPEILTRLNAYETAYQMQTSAPALMDLSAESKATLDLYGCDPAKPSYARNCLLARRLIEKGVRFVQLYHTNWDSHGGPGENLNSDFEKVCRDVDQASAALVIDLKQRGLLDDTLVIWGGEFGRTPMGEVRATLGRDHHVDAFTMWMAGGGVKNGIYGATDDLGFGPVEGKIHVHDLHATMLHLLGFDHERLNFRVQGLDMRLTGIAGKLVPGIMA
jgi:hypothetical protein